MSDVHLARTKGTMQTTFQIGKAGSLIKLNGVALEARDAADAAYVNITALDPTAAQHVLTKNHFDTVAPGVAPAPAISSVALTLGFASPVVSTGTIPDSAIINRVVLDITTAYNTSDATVLIDRTGDGTKILLAAAESDLDDADTPTFQSFDVFSWGATGAGTVTATIGGTATAGAATLRVYYSTPTDIT